MSSQHQNQNQPSRLTTLMAWQTKAWWVARFAMVVSGLITFHGLDSGDTSSAYAQIEPYMLMSVSMVIAWWGFKYLIEFGPTAFLIEDRKGVGVVAGIMGGALLCTSILFGIQGMAGRECSAKDITQQNETATGGLVAYKKRAAQLAAAGVAVQTQGDNFAASAESERLYGLVSGSKRTGPVYATLLRVQRLFVGISDSLAAGAKDMNDAIDHGRKVVGQINRDLGDSSLTPTTKARKANAAFLDLNFDFANLYARDLAAVAGAEASISGIENNLNAAGAFVDGPDAERVRQSVEKIRSDVIAARKVAAKAIDGLKDDDAIMVGVFRARGPWESILRNWPLAIPYFFYALAADVVLMGMVLASLWFLVRRGQAVSVATPREPARSSPPAFVAKKFGGSDAAQEPEQGQN